MEFEARRKVSRDTELAAALGNAGVRLRHFAPDAANDIGPGFVDETWADVVRGVRSEMAKANARIAERCRKLGIPRDFAPGLEFHWRDRGANAVKARREELDRKSVV